MLRAQKRRWKLFKKLQSQTPDLVLLDVQMPVMDGFTTCQKIKSDLLLRHIPVMMLTAQAGVSSKVTGLERGADDYITKPFDLQELIARIRTLLRRTRQGLEANPLTRLPGNITIENEILGRLEAHQPFAVLYLDLNSFKAYNDTYGFLKGDEVIRETAKIILKEADKDRGFVGHIGGDDFISCPDGSPRPARHCASGIIARFRRAGPARFILTLTASAATCELSLSGAARKRALRCSSIAIGVVTNQYRAC